MPGRGCTSKINAFAKSCVCELVKSHSTTFMCDRQLPALPSLRATSFAPRGQAFASTAVTPLMNSIFSPVKGVDSEIASAKVDW